MDSLWLEAPSPALRLWSEAGVARHRTNPAADAWGVTVGWSAADWDALAARVIGHAAPGACGDVTEGLVHLRWKAVALEPGWLVWLQPRDVFAGVAELGQQFRRFGLFVRDLVSGRAFWDAQVYAMFGLPPRPGAAPGFDEALACVHPDDRAAVVAQHRAALAVPMRREVHYRVVWPNGSVRYLQALIETGHPVEGRPTRMVGLIIDATEGRQQAQAQKLAAEQLLRAIELAGLSLWRIDLARRWIDYNQAGLRLLGLPDDVTSMPLDETRAMIHPDDLARIVAAADLAARCDRVVDVVARYRHADGSWHHLLTRRIAERDESGRVVALAGISLDHTAQVEANERALALARRIELVAEAAGVGVWMLDLETGAVDWNVQMRRIHGLPDDAPVPRLPRWLAQVHADDRRAVVRAARAALDGSEGGFETDFRIRRPDGSWRWVAARGLRDERDGRAVLLGIHLDVTDRRATEDELRRQQERLATATRVTGVGVWERGADGEATYWDAQMYRLRGLDPSDPRPLAEITAATSDPALHGQLLVKARAALQAGEAYEHEFRCTWPDGSEHWILSTGAVRRDAQGRAIGMIGVNLDVTERRRAEAALRERDAAERANRLKSEFLARMSHELRTPLNAVLGFAQLLEHEGLRTLAPAQLERVSRIRTAGQHLLGLIEDVLDLSAVEAGALPIASERVALDPTLDEVREWVAPLAERQGVRIEAGPTGAFLHGDPRRVRQVLANLLTNAIKYNRRGGRVWFGAAPGPGATWLLEVHDDGPGLTAEQQAHLFEPFNRLGAERRDVDGVGLGLVIVRRLVEAMGGTIAVDSTLGRGTTIGVRLPAAPAPGAEPAPAGIEAPDAHDAADALTVLYVEDNPVNVLLVQELLALRPGVRFASAADGLAGVRAAQAAPPDIVLVDIHLPDVDGYEVLRRLRAAPATQGCRVVALSANALPEEVQRARAAGFDDYWTKPIDFGHFLAGVDALLAGKGVVA